MNQHRFPCKGSTMFGRLLILLSLVMSACGSAVSPEVAVATVKVEVTKVSVTEVEKEVVVTRTQPAAGNAIHLSFLYPGSGESQEMNFISDAVAQFNDQHPDIYVDLKFVPPSEYWDTLQTSIIAGTPPDLAKLVFSNVFQLYNQKALLPVEEIGAIDPDFLEDSLNSVMFNGAHYGLPQRRDSCALAYDYLSVFSGSEQPKEAFLLMDFLTQAAQQEAAYKDLFWYPTRQSSYDALGLECSANMAIRLPVEYIQPAIDQVQERSPSLTPVMDGGTVLFQETTGVVENNELVGSAAPVWSPLSIDEAKAKMDSSGLVMGVLFINNVEEYPSGDYVVKCYTDKCVLVRPDESEIDYDLKISEELAYPVSIPRVSTEPGSDLVCHWYWFWKRCTRVG